MRSRPDDTTLGSVPPYKFVFVENRINPVSSDPKSEERRRRLRVLAQETFPDGKMPDLYASVWINKFGGADRDLPFVPATIVLTPLDDDPDHPTEQRFENVWCILGLKCRKYSAAN